MAILEWEKDNNLLKKVLLYANDPYTPFNVRKVSKTSRRNDVLHSNKEGWWTFLRTCDKCSSRELSGNAAVEALEKVFKGVDEESEKWMRAVLNKHLNIGISAKTINKVFPDLIPFFEVSLAQKFEAKRINNKKSVFVEPKLDGGRCISIVENGNVTMLARSGRAIVNFEDTIGQDLAKLPDGVYDGEIMSNDFQALMQQIHRKYDIDTSGTYLALFDYVSLEEWKGPDKMIGSSCRERYNTLCDNLDTIESEQVQVVARFEVHPDDITSYQLQFVSEGYEGTMIKDPEAQYRRGRGYEVMKLKDFLDVDCEVLRLEEGTGKFEGTLGALIVNHEGVEVGVGSGFTEDEREEIWSDPERFIGQIAEMRCQEITPDGSLRFPTFVQFRHDRV
jgi:DNA ligase-1